MLLKGLALLAAVGSVAAQRPSNTSICDYYTTALLKNNTAENQLALLTLVVNTAVIGNYTTPNVGIKVDGILANGTFNGTDVSLAPYFSGALASSNRGGQAVAINFLDDGGAAPLLESKAALGTESNQYKLLTHLYQYFGVLLECSLQGTPGYSSYQGQPSQYQVHKFMDLSPYELGYFITQVGLSAASFGVAEEDVSAVGTALSTLFGYRCSPPTTVVPAQGPQLQSMCGEVDTCPLDPNATCSLADNNGTSVAPAPNGTVAAPSGTGTPPPPQVSTSGAAGLAGYVSLAAVLGALIVFAV
ncbi:MAG: hypothetical protein M1832_004688 [Thelocarpon impressellum]|nr:MAG: hypothetical protein M1832_004688 [Thelocarpon impressellum]